MNSLSFFAALRLGVRIRVTRSETISRKGAKAQSRPSVQPFCSETQTELLSLENLAQVKVLG